MGRSHSRSLHFFLRISSKMSKLLVAIIGLILVVLVSANTETNNQNADISLQNDLLIRDAREAGRKDKKGKKSKAKKKRKTKGNKRRNGNKNKSKRRLKTKQKKNKESK